MSDHNSRTPGPIWLKLCLVNSVTTEMFLALSGSTLIYGKVAKTVIYDQARVNGGSNYEYPMHMQRWVINSACEMHRMHI